MTDKVRSRGNRSQGELRFKDLNLRFKLYLGSYVLEVVASPPDHITKAENRTVQIILFVKGASFKVSFIRCFQDIGPKRQ